MFIIKFKRVAVDKVKGKDITSASPVSDTPASEAANASEAAKAAAASA